MSLSFGSVQLVTSANSTSGNATADEDCKVFPHGSFWLCTFLVILLLVVVMTDVFADCLHYLADKLKKDEPETEEDEEDPVSTTAGKPLLKTEEDEEDPVSTTAGKPLLKANEDQASEETEASAQTESKKVKLRIPTDERLVSTSLANLGLLGAVFWKRKYWTPCGGVWRHVVFALGAKLIFLVAYSFYVYADSINQFGMKNADGIRFESAAGGFVQWLALTIAIMIHLNAIVTRLLKGKAILLQKRVAPSTVKGIKCVRVAEKMKNTTPSGFELIGVPEGNKRWWFFQKKAAEFEDVDDGEESQVHFVPKDSNDLDWDSWATQLQSKTPTPWTLHSHGSRVEKFAEFLLWFELILTGIVAVTGVTVLLEMQNFLFTIIGSTSTHFILNTDVLILSTHFSPVVGRVGASVQLLKPLSKAKSRKFTYLFHPYIFSLLMSALIAFVGYNVSVCQKEAA